MRFVLRNGGGYYAGMTVDKFSCRGPWHSTDIAEAVVFHASVEGGVLQASPELPEGDWEIELVSIRPAGIA